jgi:hypothetical protein
MRDRDFANDLLFGRFGSSLSWPRVMLYATTVMALIVITKTSTLAVVVPHLTQDGHGILSLSIAVNRSFCGVPSALSTEAQIGEVLFRDTAASTQPVPEVIAARWGSMERYCSTVTRPFVNNENSLMLLESWTWRVAPNLSLVGVGRVLLAVKIGLLLFFCIVFFRLGAGMVLCYFVLDTAFALLGRLQPTFGYSTYSFLLCLVMATVALYPLMLSVGRNGRVRQIAWTAIAGIWSAFVVNMRTSYLPLCAAFAMLYVGALLLELNAAGASNARKIQGVVAAVLLFAIGYAGFQYSFIARNRATASETLSHHTFFHPLVLSVGLPENAFSLREGIAWDDSVGLTLAHRVNPSATYLSKEYEEALAVYYVDLWKRHPAEMRRVYVEKAKLAATEMMALTDVPDPIVNVPRIVLRAAPNGVWLLALLAGFTIASAWRYLRRGMPVLMLMTLIGAAGTMLMIECILIIPRYFLTYHAPLLWVYCSVTFIVFQIAVNWIARSLSAGVSRPTLSTAGETY